MNRVYIHLDGTYLTEGQIFLASLYKVCPSCEVFAQGYNIDPNKLRSSWGGRFQFRAVPKKQYVGRIATSKIERLEDIPMQDGDQVLCLDVDMIVKRDPFEIFRKEGDVFVTTRPKSWKHPVNGGVWGFRYSTVGDRFVRFHIDQVQRKTWKPYRNYLKKYGHLKEVNWRVGQDFLNTIYLNKLPFLCKVSDAGWRWNFLHDSGSKRKFDKKKQAEQDALFSKAKKAYKKAWKDPSVGILHFKARMKGEMKHYV